MRRYIWIASALMAPLAFFASMSGCNKNSGGDDKKIKIVSSMPRTGSAKGQTDSIVFGVKIAFEEVNFKVGDFTIEFEDLDDATAQAGNWTTEKEAGNANQAVNDPNVMIYIGPYNSGAAGVSMPILNKADILMISPACTRTALTKPNTGDKDEPAKYRPSGKINFTRVIPADDLQGPQSANWARELGAKKVFILHDTELYGKGIAQDFERRCQELKIEVLGFDALDYKQADFKTKLTTIKDKKPDLIYFGGTSQTGGPQLVKDMINVGLNETCSLMGPDGCYENAFIQGAGAANFAKLKCYVTFGGYPPEKLTGRGADFVKKYKEKHKIEPEAYAIYGYECGVAAIEAIKKAGKKDRNAIREAGVGMKDVDGGLGKWSIDANGDITRGLMSGAKISPEGKFEFVSELPTQ